jgi:menaquinone-dependent protoporphyrinogen oxidase
MKEKILVTYASRTGSTAGVAEEISNVLAENGAQVDVIPILEVSDLSPYWAVVAGSAIQNRQWLPEALQFIQLNRSALRQKPSAIFTLCMTLAMRNGERYYPQVSEWISPVRNLVKPISEAIFAGVLDIDKIPSFSDRLKFRLSVAFGVWSEGDHRDWNAINKWASELFPILESVEKEGE